MAVAISPRWNSTVTSEAGLTSILSAKSAKRGARADTDLGAVPRGIWTPPTIGACCCSNSCRFAASTCARVPACRPRARRHPGCCRDPYRYRRGPGSRRSATGCSGPVPGPRPKNFQDGLRGRRHPRDGRRDGPWRWPGIMPGWDADPPRPAPRDGPGHRRRELDARGVLPAVGRGPVAGGRRSRRDAASPDSRRTGCCPDARRPRGEASPGWGRTGCCPDARVRSDPRGVAPRGSAGRQDGVRAGCPGAGAPASRPPASRVRVRPVPARARESARAPASPRPASHSGRARDVPMGQPGPRARRAPDRRQASARGGRPAAWPARASRPAHPRLGGTPRGGAVPRGLPPWRTPTSRTRRVRSAWRALSCCRLRAPWRARRTPQLCH